jgi:hypothetical protein
MVAESTKPDHVAGSIMVSVLSADTGEKLHESISLRAFVALLGAGDQLDEFAAFYEEQICHTGGIEIDTPRGAYALFVKGRKCKCCGHTN